MSDVRDREGTEIGKGRRSDVGGKGLRSDVGGKGLRSDVDPVSQNITAETIAAALSPRTKGIVVVHLAGWPCDMDPIMNLAREKGLWVVFGLRPGQWGDL